MHFLCIARCILNAAICTLNAHFIGLNYSELFMFNVVLLHSIENNKSLIQSRNYDNSPASAC